MFFLPRVILGSIWFCLSCAVGIMAGILRPFNPKNTKLTTDLIKWGRHLIGLHIELAHPENMEKRPCVFISNHQDNLDIFPGSFALPPNTVTIGKRSIIFIPFFGQFFWLSGNLFINRKNKRKAFETMDVAARAISERGISVWIMPEGTRSRGRGILPFKKGPFITAIKAQVPIVPVAISSYTSHVHLSNWTTGSIFMEALPAIETKGKTLEDVNLIKDQAENMIREAVAKLDLNYLTKKNHE